MLGDILKFIITGMPHSGTTPISDVFRNVPGLTSGFECGFLLHKEPRNFVNPKNSYYQIYYENLKQYWGVTDDEVSYITESDNWEEVYVKLRQKSRKISDKSLVLFDKTPHYIFYLDDILKRAEDIPVIVVYKDARLQYWSFKRRKEKDYKLLMELLDNEFAEKLLHYHNNGRILLVRYEEMCLNPEAAFRKMFDYVDIEFNNNYLSFDSDYRPHYGNRIEKKYITAYREKMDKDEYDAVRAMATHPLFYYDVEVDEDLPLQQEVPLFYIVPDYLQHRSKGYAFLRGNGLEIGAFDQPAFLPSGCNVVYSDIISRNEAAEIFSEHKIDDLVDVQHICNLDKEGLSCFKEESFDFVILNHVLEHVVNPIKALEEIFSVIKAGGFAVISVFDKDCTHINDLSSSLYQDLFFKYDKNIDTAGEEDYLEFVRRAHPEVFELGDAEIQSAVARAKARREHIHLWNSNHFMSFLQDSFKLLDISVKLVFMSPGEKNGFECFSVWEK